jgi:hypothetical protein
MITFLYTSDYVDGSTSSSTPAMSKSLSPSPERAPSVISIAPSTETTSEIDVKPQVNGIKIPPTSTVSAEKLCSPLLTNTEVYILAKMFNLPRLKESAGYKFVQCLKNNTPLVDFVESLRLMHSETFERDMALKDVAIDFAVSNIGPLSAREDFKGFCKTTAANDFVLQMLLRMTDMVLKACPKCKTNATVKSVKKPTSKYNQTFSCVCGHEWN